MALLDDFKVFISFNGGNSADELLQSFLDSAVAQIEAICIVDLTTYGIPERYTLPVLQLARLYFEGRGNESNSWLLNYKTFDYTVEDEA